MKPYPDYRDSDVEWAPTLPARWNATRLQRVASIYAGGTPDRTNLDYWTDGSVPWLNSGSVNDVVIRKPSALITEDASSGGRTRWAPAGSVLVALAGQGRTKGMAARLEFASTLNQSMAAIVPASGLDYRFLQYWVGANYQSVRNLAGGDLRDGLNLQHIGAIQVPLPSIHEQDAIAGFLDRETAEIDAFIADQEELIELLAERRAATISHAVTKGLDPNAPMKDTAIDGLRKVPARWRAMTVRRTGPRMESGTSVNGYQLPAQNGEVGVLKTGSVSKGYFDPSENKRVLEEELERVTAPVRAGHLIVNRANTPDLVGRAGIVDCQPDGLFLSDKLWQIRFADVDARFMYYWTLSDRYRAQLRTLSVGASHSMQNLSYSDFLSLTIAVPPAGEQRRIAEHLDRETAEIDAAIADAREAIALSRERRAALIWAAVTGKIDVRDESREMA